MNNKYLTIGITFFILVTTLILITIQINKPKPSEFLLDLSHELNAFYPMQVDQVTVLNKTYVEGNNLIYDYTIDNEEFKLTGDDIKKILQNRVIVGICSNPQSMSVLDTNSSILYKYSDKKQKSLLTLTIKKDDCIKNFK